VGVDVAWVDERHEQKQFVSDNAQWITKLAISRWPKLSGSVCLRFVEAWSDAVFNQAQIPELISELRNEVAAATHAGTRAHLEKVLRLVEKAEGQTHTYIKFIGD
jgi:hypothetical protein